MHIISISLERSSRNSPRLRAAGTGKLPVGEQGPVGAQAGPAGADSEAARGAGTGRSWVNSISETSVVANCDNHWQLGKADSEAGSLWARVLSTG